VEAAAWYRRAADQGDGRAMYRLALLHAEGRGAPVYKSDWTLGEQAAAQADEGVDIVETEGALGLL